MEKAMFLENNENKCSKAFSRFKKARNKAKAEQERNLKDIKMKKINFFNFIIKNLFKRKYLINLWIKLKKWNLEISLENTEKL